MINPVSQIIAKNTNEGDLYEREKAFLN